LVLAQANELSSHASRRLGECGERSADRVSRRRDGEEMVRRLGAFRIVRGSKVRQHARIERERAHDPFAISELEERLDRITVAASGRDVVDPDRVGRSEIREEDDAGFRVPREDRLQLIALAEPHFRLVAHLARAFDPTVAAQDDPGVLIEDELLLVVLRLDEIASAHLRAARVAEGFAHLRELLLHLAPQTLLAREELFDRGGLRLLVAKLVEDDLDLEARELVEAQIEDGIDLHAVELEALHELLGRILAPLRATNDPGRLVEGIEDDSEALEDVDPLAELLEIEAIAALDHDEAEIDEVREERLQVEARRCAGSSRANLDRNEARHIDVEVRLQRGVAEEVRHDLLGVGIALELENDPDLLRRLIADVDDHGHLASEDEIADRADEHV